MTVAGHLTTLAAGLRPDRDGLLGNCRLEWHGTEAYGEEAILELFRASPFPGDDAILIETAMSAAWIGAGAGLVADLYDGRIGRLWRIGPGEPPAPEPMVSVAFDPDLSQSRGDVLMRVEDHPELAANAAADVLAAGRALVLASPPQPLHRARAFVVRAFTGDGGTAALFAVHRLTGGATRGSGFGYAAGIIGTPAIADFAPERPWTPRL